MTIDRLPNTGQAVIIDIGEAQDIHPRNKQDVAKRLARWALARDYGVKIPYQSPTYKGLEKDGDKIVLSFSHVGGGLRAFDVPEVKGFTIAGPDKVFHKATAKLVGPDKVEVTAKAFPTLFPSVTAGPTTRSSTSTAAKACPSLPSAPIAGRVSPPTT